MAQSVRDADREKTYQSEYRLRDFLRTAEEIENPTIIVDGITMTLPPEAKFGSIESIQAYVDRVAGPGEVKVRERKGGAWAVYEPWARTIAICPEGTRWAMRELVVLHELAHHWTHKTFPGVASHGVEFRVQFRQLLEQVMGPEVGLLYRILCGHNGLST